MARKIQIKNLHKHITPEMEEKHFDTFSKRAGYAGNGIYRVFDDLFSTDTRELFLMYCARMEGLNFEK